MKSIKGNEGFTLAEVLITLGIIGVVAAMTIPTLLVNVQKQQYVSLLKKSYTEMSQAVQNIATDRGCVVDMACTGLFSTGTDNQSWGDELTKYVKTIKICGIAESLGCMSEIIYNLDGSLDTNPPRDNDVRYKFVLATGVSVNTENMNVWGYPDCSNSSNKSCARITFDVNGAKPPNMNGRDNFRFDLLKSGQIVPEDTYSRKIMSAGWEMNY